MYYNQCYKLVNRFQILPSIILRFPSYCSFDTYISFIKNCKYNKCSNTFVARCTYVAMRRILSLIFYTRRPVRREKERGGLASDEGRTMQWRSVETSTPIITKEQ